MNDLMLYLKAVVKSFSERKARVISDVVPLMVDVYTCWRNGNLSGNLSYKMQAALNVS